ncbi:MAG: hypothetical protein RL199_2095, partial [Pseudomonadota bacterium]
MRFQLRAALAFGPLFYLFGCTATPPPTTDATAADAEATISFRSSEL